MTVVFYINQQLLFTINSMTLALQHMDRLLSFAYLVLNTAALQSTH